MFEKDERVKPINLEMLKMSASLADGIGRYPATRPVEHYQIIERISDLALAKNYKVEYDPIYIAKSGVDTAISKSEKNKPIPIDRFVFRRLVTRFNIMNLSDDKHNACVALGYTERGIQVAFGANVRVCSNMSIFGGRMYMTYGNQSIPYDKLMELIIKNINEMPDIAEQDFSTLNRMYEFPIQNSDVVETLGTMHVRSVKNAYYQDPFPLNIGQMSSFTKGLVASKPKLLEDTEDIVSLYDFYNTGTQILHPDRADITTVWPDVALWGEFVKEHFNLN